MSTVKYKGFRADMSGQVILVAEAFMIYSMCVDVALILSQAFYKILYKSSSDFK